jgi:hypothetical protein
MITIQAQQLARSVKSCLLTGRQRDHHSLVDKKVAYQISVFFSLTIPLTEKKKTSQASLRSFPMGEGPVRSEK